VATADTAYCRYTWTSDSNAAPDLRALASLGEYEIDFPVISAAGLGSQALEFQKQYRQQTGRVAYTTDVTPAPRAPVWVAVIDSAVHTFSDVTPDRFGHGRAVGTVVHDLACGDLSDKECGLRIENTLAMPQVDKTTLDYANGGYFGSRMQLADALEATLAAWVKSNAEVKSKLVINLSLGWDQAVNDRYPAPKAANAVKITLQRAVCSGAVVFAAAGNRNPVSNKGVIFPAAWETEAALDVAACRRVGIDLGKRSDANAKANKAPHAPLLYAVGGVDQYDVPLATTRIDGQARLTAYGLAVVTDEVRPAVAYTGSSMATAVLSGVAAAAWSYAPNLTAAELVAKLYETGNVVDPVYGVPSVCLGGVACHSLPIRRVSLCAGLGAVGVTSTCTAPGAMAGAPASMPTVPTGSNSTAACTGPLCPPDTSGSSAEPWVNPQPGDPLCPSCQIDRQGGNVKIAGWMTGAGSNSHYIEVYRYSGIYIVSYDGAYRTYGDSVVNMPLQGEYPGWPTTQAEINLWLNLGYTWVWIGSQQIPVN